jgi:hypothetical protein
MYLEKNLEKKWIIKSENRILGPYSFDQIIDLLQKKQISIIDEIRDPETRWLYVRENKDFKNIVEEIRKEIDSRQESTKTYQSSAGTVTTTTTTATSATSNMGFEELLQKTKTDINVNEDTNADYQTKDVEVVRETIIPRTEPSPIIKIENAKMYGVQTDASVQNQITSYSTRLRIMLAALIILVGSSYGGYVYFKKQNVIKKEESMVAQVRQLRYANLFQKATEAYLALPEAYQKNMLLQLLDMYPVLEKNGAINAEQIKILKNSNINLSIDQKVNIDLINFWLAAKDQNYGQASDNLTLANQKDSSNKLIKENQAWLSLKKSSAKEAYDEFVAIKVENQNPPLGRMLFGRVASYIRLPDIDKSKLTAPLLNEIDKYTIVQFNLRKELLLAQIYLSKELNDEPIINDSLKAFFNTVPLLSEQFIKPNLIFPNAYTWKELEWIKAAVLTKLNGDNAILFQLHDYLEMNQLNQAADFITEQLPKVQDAKVKAQMNLLLYYAQSRYRDVVALHATKALDMNSALNNFIVARSSLRVEPKKSVQEHIKVLEDQNQRFYSSWLELDSMIAKGKTQDAKTFISFNFPDNKDFLPVIEASYQEN